jgi:hypothetical protein
MKIAKSRLLKKWMMEREWFTTHDLSVWGSKNWFHRADRQAREMTVNGELERLNLSQQYHLGIVKPGANEIGAWRYIGGLK